MTSTQPLKQVQGDILYKEITMEENITNEIVQELDMIRILSKMSKCVIINEFENINYSHFKLVFEDIEKRCWNISDLVEKINTELNL
jgi:hypothetical protein